MRVPRYSSGTLMFESHDAVPWYRSLAGVIGASVILPPLGIVLLWMRRGTATATKILATAGIVALGAGYVYLYMQWSGKAAKDAHYAALEANRAEQAAQPATSGQPNTNTAQQAASATGSPTPTDEKAAAH